MILYIKKLLKKIGFDMPILYTSFSNLIGVFGNVFILFLIISFLTKTEQGFYFTFASILSLQIFFELGFNAIITQYSAHESVNIFFDNKSNIFGNEVNISRIASLFRLIVKWYTVLFIIIIIFLVSSGLYFFSTYEKGLKDVIWREPWILLVISSSLNMLLSPFLSFLSGIGKITLVSKLQLFQNIFKLSLTGLFLSLGFHLFSIGLSLFFSTLIISIIVIKDFKNLFIFLWKVKINEKISYRKEIFPYQWKIAISWISGYFIFQMFNPIIFAFEGPEIAGQMGMSLSAISGISNLSIAWMSTKIPIFSKLIANKNKLDAKKLFDVTLKQLVTVNLILFCFFISILILLNYFKISYNGIYISERFLNFLPLILLILISIFNQFVSSWAIYLRCFKQEPYLLNSIVAAILISFSTYFMEKYFGVYGVVISYFLISLSFLPWSYFTFRKGLTKYNL